MIPTPRQSAPDARRTANLLVEELQREQVDRLAAASAGLGSGEIDVTPALLEQAKGALMLHFGVDSHEAFAVLLRWARASHTPVAVIARTLLRGICEGNPQTEERHRALVRWLEAQLRQGVPDHAPARTAPAG